MTKLSSKKYVAGYLDGEGCFQIHSGGSPRVSVSNTHRPTLDHLKELYGGNVRKRNRATKEHRAIWEWTVYGDNAIRVCKEMLPHLKEKQMQAAAILNHRYESRPEAKKVLEDLIKTLKRL